jgi:hypothetical protein
MKVSRQCLDYEFGHFTRKLIFIFRWNDSGRLEIKVSSDYGRDFRKIDWWLIPVMFGDDTWNDLKAKAQEEAVCAP